MTDAPRSRQTTGKSIGLVFASLAILVGIVAFLAGTAMVALDAFARDDDGYLTSPAESFESDGFAVVAGDIDLSTDPADWAPSEVLGTARIAVEGDGQRPLFAGIGTSADVNEYLAGVSYDVVEDIETSGPVYSPRAGARRPGPPTRQDFWVVSSAGEGRQVLDWEAESGVWSLVVMNETGAPRIAFTAEAGVEIDWLGGAGLVALILGIIVGGTGLIAFVLIVRASRAQPGPEAAEAPTSPPAPS